MASAVRKARIIVSLKSGGKKKKELLNESTALHSKTGESRTEERAGNARVG